MAPELEREHAARIAEAKALIAKDAPLETDFLEKFFALGDKEDLARYQAAEIAELTHRSFV